MYAGTGPPSIPPERLSSGSLWMALYTVRGDRQLCELLDYNELFRWLLDLDMVEHGLDHGTFPDNRERLLAHDVAAQFFDLIDARRPSPARPTTCFASRGSCHSIAFPSLVARSAAFGRGRPPAAGVAGEDGRRGGQLNLLSLFLQSEFGVGRQLPSINALPTACANGRPARPSGRAYRRVAR